MKKADIGYEDGCTCSGATYASREVISLARDGKVDLVARTYSALTVERAAAALKSCVKANCCCLGDHDDAVLEQFEAIVEEADAEDAEPECSCRLFCAECV